MSVRKRCFIYCNDCHGKDPWKIVDADSNEARDHKLVRCGNCEDFQKKCHDKKRDCERDGERDGQRDGERDGKRDNDYGDNEQDNDENGLGENSDELFEDDNIYDGINNADEVDNIYDSVDTNDYGQRNNDQKDFGQKDFGQKNYCRKDFGQKDYSQGDYDQGDYDQNDNDQKDYDQGDWQEDYGRGDFGCKKSKPFDPCHCKKNKCPKGDKGSKGDKGAKGDKGNKGDIGVKGEPGRTFACTLISVKNPDADLVIPTPFPVVAAVIGDFVDFTGWTDIVPDVFDAFDNVTGIYTTPEDGDYQVELVVNYQINTPIPIPSNDLSFVPDVQIYDVDTDERILASTLSATDMIVPLPPDENGTFVRVTNLVAKGQVIIKAIIPLSQGQRIRVRATTNGLVFLPVGPPGPVPPAIIDFSPENLDTTLGIYKLRNSPIVSIDCNN